MNTLTPKKWVGVFIDTNGIPSKFQNFWLVLIQPNAFFFCIRMVKNVKIQKHLC